MTLILQEPAAEPYYTCWICFQRTELHRYNYSIYMLLPTPTSHGCRTSLLGFFSLSVSHIFNWTLQLVRVVWALPHQNFKTIYCIFNFPSPQAIVSDYQSNMATFVIQTQNRCNMFSANLMVKSLDTSTYSSEWCFLNCIEVYMDFMVLQIMDINAGRRAKRKKIPLWVKDFHSLFNEFCLVYFTLFSFSFCWNI